MSADQARRRYPESTVLVDAVEYRKRVYARTAPAPQKRSMTATVFGAAGNLLLIIVTAPIAAILLYFAFEILKQMLNGG